MELEIVIDKKCKEKIIVYAHERSALVEQIEELAGGWFSDLTGFNEHGAVKLSSGEIVCFISQDNKVFALTEQGRFRVKCRLYQLEESLGDNFIKINQSCIANIKKISCFKGTIGGALKVDFVNGYCDYVSRRNLRSVKERLGL